MRFFLRSSVACCLLSAVLMSSARADNIVETAVKAGSFKTLAAALQAGGLVQTLSGKGPFTVFAPTDEAFAKLPKGTVETLLKPENKGKLVAILTYHVVPGKVMAGDVVKLSAAKTVNGQQVGISAKGGVKVDKANVVKTDIQCSNGVIHVIDSVILPETKTIPEVADAAGSFKTLLAAAKAAGLVDALVGKGPLTVFAPTDKAFGKLPKGTIATLLKPENKTKLANILKYHVVAGRVYAADVVKLSSAKTLLGAPVTISATNGVMINKSKVIATDIDAANGVIHVIDSVLMPPMNRNDACAMIEGAVRQGAHMFNTGHHASCAKIYMNTMQQLMDTRVAGMGQHDYHRMQTTLSAASREHHASRRAWMLRHEIDRAYSLLRSSH